jgi:cytochrome P450
MPVSSARAVPPKASSAAAAFQFDPFEHAVLQDDPYPIYSELREQHPVYYNRERDLWVLSRFEDVQAAARDWEIFSSADGVNLDDIKDVEGPGNFLDMDPPGHDLLRRLVQKTFTPRGIKELEPFIRDTTYRLLTAMVGRGTADLAQEFAWPLPVATIAHIFGFPDHDLAQLSLWAQQLIVRESGSVTVPTSVRAYGAQFHAYFAAAVQERRRVPRSDLISTIAGSAVEGRPLSDEVLGMSISIFGAATETTASLIGNALLLLGKHPEQRERLLEQPGLIDSAVEECLRYEPSAQYLARTTRAPVEFHGRTIPAGARVVLVFAAANRDPRRWEEPDRFDITRTPQRTLAFGAGIHHCLGAPLARVQARTAISMALKLLPRYSVVRDVIRPSTRTTLRNISHLPVVLESP